MKKEYNAPLLSEEKILIIDVLTASGEEEDPNTNYENGYISGGNSSFWSGI